tara:strand:+ start:128 stop:358 length:231 start_codon:yes stop_codon:yes gene_type:complete
MMIEFAFVLVVSTNPIVDEFKYEGNFSNCDIAFLWMSLYRPNAISAKCMLTEYIKLPEDTILKGMDMKNGTIKHGD